MGLWEQLSGQVDQPETPTSLWDSMAKGVEVGGHAAELAKHRWSRLKANEAADTFPTPEGNQPYGGQAGPVLGDLARPTVGGGFPTPDKPLPTMPTIAPVAPGEAPTGERLLRNTAIGAANLPSNTVNFFTSLVNSPQETVAGLVEQGKAMGKAGLWTAAKSVNPQLGPIAEAAGLGPDQFNEMFLADPVGTGALVLGGAEGMRRGLKGLGEAPAEAPAVEAPVEGAPNYPGGYLDPNWAKSPEGQAYLAEHPETAALWEKMAAKKARPEQRTDTATREVVGGAVNDLREANLSHIQALDEIEALKAAGKIDARIESAMRREADKVYSGKLAPEVPPDPTEGHGLSEERMKELDEVRRKYEAAETPQVDLSPEYREWFGKSKVATENGDPITVYHQTGVEKEAAIRKQGFSTAPELAGDRAGDRAVPNGIFFKPTSEDIGVGGARIAGSFERGPTTQIPVHLSLQNPLIVKNRTALGNWAMAASPEFADLAKNPVRGRDAMMRGILDKLLPEQGYDGVIFEEDKGSMGRATKTYIALRPDQIRFVPDKGVTEAAKVVETPAAMPAAVEAGVRTPATEHSSPSFINDMGDLLAGTIGEQFKADAIMQAEGVNNWKERLNEAVDALRQFKATKGGFEPAMAETRQVDPAFYDHAVADIVAPVFATIEHNQFMRGLAKDVLAQGLDLDTAAGRAAAKPILEKRFEFFGKIMMDDASKAVDLKNKSIVELQRQFADAATKDEKATIKAELQHLGATPDSEIRPNKLPKMTEEELAQEQGNPMWQAAVDYHKQGLQAALEAEAEEAGVGSRLYGPRGTYMPLKRYTRTSDAPKGAKLYHAPESAVNTAYDYTKTKTRAAKGRTGDIPEGMFVSMDYAEHALAGRIARRKSAYRRQLQQAIIDRNQADPKTGVPPADVKVNGRTVRLAPVTILNGERTPGAKGSVTSWVPKPVADAYHLATNKPYNEKALIARLLQAYANTALVLMPAEAAMHSLNMVSVLAAADKVGVRLGKGGALARYLPVVGKMGLAIHDIVNQPPEMLAANMRTLAEHGGLRTSSFKELGTGKEVTEALTRTHDLSPKKLLFGYPDRANWGVDTRVKSALLEMVRQGEPGISDSDAVRRVNAISGTYVKKLGPLMGKILAPIYPFAKATTALARTGVQATFGFDPSTGKFSLRGWTQNVIGPVIGATLLAKSLDDNGRWWWEHPGAKPFDMTFTKNGTVYSIPLRLFIPLLYRGLTATGTREAIAQYLRDEGDQAFKRVPSLTTVEDVGRVQLRGAFNYWRNKTGPAIQAAQVLGTGDIPYQLPNGDYIHAEDADMQHPLRARVKAAAATAIAPYHKLEEGSKQQFQTKTGQFINDKLEWLGAGIQAHPESKERAIQASGNKAYKETLDDTIGDILRESRNRPPGEQRKWINEQINSRLPKDGIIMVFGKPTPVRVYALNESLRRSTPHAKSIPPAVGEKLRLAR